ncbi:AEC family transporter [Oxalicibacterium faecigallinarum]|uniref:Permease n=1 Tax=Oxalicibacterium faecigallinarum TaxID=573741 RepID=A0A8J3F466_9BURK|nr:AEC family transporter [Oxalicibacterium faecigallinarum]GGI20524.1 permease [Oxalicibacterium faecigallinarum]
MNSPAVPALFSVVFIIATGFCLARLKWVRQASITDLSNLVFYVLTPALLFRTMMNVKLSELDYAPIGVYFLAVALIFLVTIMMQGLTTLGSARALAHTFSNTVMIGIPLASLVYGESGLISLLTLISVHALVLMTGGTVAFELAVARQARRDGISQSMWRTLGTAIKNSILHPVPIPIIVGVLYAQTGLPLPDMVDKPLQLMGQALGPMSLLLVGVTLAFSKLKGNLMPALRIAVIKTIVHPVVFVACAWLFGLSGIPMATMALAASLPVGANVFLFTQRYHVAEDEVSASIFLSTVLAFLSLPLIFIVIPHLI